MNSIRSRKSKVKLLISGIVIFVLILFIIVFYFYNLNKVEAGIEAVQVHQPYIFGDGGTDSTVLSTGNHFVWPSTSLYPYNLKPMNKTETFVDISSSDNVPLDLKIHFYFRQIQGKTPELHKNFGKNWYKNKVKEDLRTIVRNEVRTRTADDLRINEVIITQAGIDITDMARTYLKNNNIPVVLQKTNIGKVVPPQEVLNEAAATAAQVQRKLTEDNKAAAEIQRKFAEEKRAEADNAYLEKMNMDVNQYLKSYQLQIMEMAVKSGKNISFNVIVGGDAIPMFNVGK
jgi:hypothetical protein